MVAAFAAFSAGYAFRESMVIHGGDRPMHLISAGRGAFFGALIGLLVVELVAVAIGHL